MRCEKGFSLTEVLIALAILGIIGVGFLSGLATASKVLFTADERTTAESLAQSYMEYIKKQTYDDTNNPPQYSLLSGIPDGYTLAITAERLDPVGDGTANDDGIQKITVVVQHHGNDVITLVKYKINR